MTIQVKHFWSAKSSTQRGQWALPTLILLWLFREFQMPNVHIHPICYFLHKRTAKAKSKKIFKKLSNLSQKGSDWNVLRKRSMDTRREKCDDWWKDRSPQAMIKKKNLFLDLWFELCCCCFDFGRFYFSPCIDSPTPIKKKLVEKHLAHFHLWKLAQVKQYKLLMILCWRQRIVFETILKNHD